MADVRLHPGHVVQHLEHAFAELPSGYRYGALAGVLMLEGTGLPLVPFEPLFIATAFLVAHGRLSLWPVILYGAGGDLLGNLIGYGVGRSVGQLLLDRYGPRLHLEPARVEATRLWFWRFGGGTLFVARFFGPIRTPAILLAGLSRMPLLHYGLWCGVADLLWVAAWQVALIRFGRVSVAIWQRFGGPAAALAFAGLLLAAAAVVVWRRVTRGGRRPCASASTTSPSSAQDRPAPP